MGPPEAAMKAIEELNGISHENCTLKVELSESQEMCEKLGLPYKEPNQFGRETKT